MTQSTYEINPVELNRLMANAERLRSIEGGRQVAGWFRAVRGWMTRQNNVIAVNRAADPTLPRQHQSGW